MRPGVPGSLLNREIVYNEDRLFSRPPSRWLTARETVAVHFTPRATRLAATALAGSAFLQFAYAYPEQKAG